MFCCEFVDFRQMLGNGLAVPEVPRLVRGVSPGVPRGPRGVSWSPRGPQVIPGARGWAARTWCPGGRITLGGDTWEF